MSPGLDTQAALKHLADFLSRDPDINVVYLFGSHAHGTANAMSDIDIALLLAERVPREEYFNKRLRYIGECAEALGTDRVDVGILNDAPLHLAYEVVVHGRILVEHNREHRVAFEVDRINRFLDFKPLLDVQVKYFKDQLLQGRYVD